MSRKYDLGVTEVTGANLKHRLAAILAADAVGYLPFHRPEHMAMLLGGLRQAGLGS